MRINAIQSGYTNRTPQAFKGHWETTDREKYVGYWDGKIRSYVPDAGESLRDIALSWRRETGLLPHEWVKEVNTYNQFENPVEYRIKGAPYMPLNVLRASADLKAEERGNYPDDNIERYLELAKLSAQAGDFPGINYCEGEVVKNFYELKSSKMEEGAAFNMDNYKDGFGSEVKARKRYQR